MQITINKSELAGALAALGKLVTRTAIIKTFQAVQIEGKADTLFFRTRNVIEEIEFKMTADLEEGFPAVLVSFEEFRLAVRNSKAKTLNLEVDYGEVFIGDVKLAPVNGRFPVPKAIPDQEVNVTELPPDTLRPNVSGQIPVITKSFGYNLAMFIDMGIRSPQMCNYFICSLLVSNKLDAFAKALERMSPILPQPLPPLYQEALRRYAEAHPEANGTP